ncbi:predicted protein [Phaeodactylum tricornutum CCAP 1055/1]|uniref:Uncharacterized protein n=1 Tax=Phaeodactylum tricornutum (strain CCAP 1055/1) TaxID=556484 RepID=B7G447_PHATC|nr:predicted protein [Phaeodactylum tricornutum CCAP 1055/1]EEC46549.1 predicted protein [Phaeodactylum tricornutum CCAP 1055/1]|eukprot:XP_002182009.1 predicted protein [Phaeodactylum tricornutum CCAP 1055/1]
MALLGVGECLPLVDPTPIDLTVYQVRGHGSNNMFANFQNGAANGIASDADAASKPTGASSRGLKGARRLATGNVEGYGRVNATSGTLVNGFAGPGESSQYAAVKQTGFFNTRSSAMGPNGYIAGSSNVEVYHTELKTIGQTDYYGQVENTGATVESYGTGYFAGNFDTEGSATAGPVATTAPGATTAPTSAPVATSSTKAPKASLVPKSTAAPKSEKATLSPKSAKGDTMNIELPPPEPRTATADEGAVAPEAVTGSVYSVAGGTIKSTVAGQGSTYVYAPDFVAPVAAPVAAPSEGVSGSSIGASEGPEGGALALTTVGGAGIYQGYATASPGGGASVTSSSYASGSANDFAADASAAGDLAQVGSASAYADGPTSGVYLPGGNSSMYMDSYSTFGVSGEATAPAP